MKSKIILLFVFCIVSAGKQRKTNPDVDCGCGDVPGEHLNWDYFFVPFYHNFIIKQIVEYYQFWAKYIVGHNISLFKDIRLKDIQITQVSDLSCFYGQVDYTQLPAGFNKDQSMKQIDSMIQRTEELKKSVKGISQFQGYFYDFRNLFDQAVDIGLDLGWISDQINSFMNTYSCTAGLALCTKENEKNIPDKFFILKVNLSFTFDGADQQRSYFIVNKLVREYRQGNLTFKFYPYFIQHACQDSGVKGIDPVTISLKKKPFANDKSFNTSELDTAIKKMQSLQKDDYDKETDSFIPQSYPSKKQQELFVNQVFALKYFGHHDRPGRSEFRTSCRHALAALRRSIEVYIRLWFEPGYTINYCPKLLTNYPKPPKKQFRQYPWWLLLIWQGRPPMKFDQPPEIPRDPPIELGKGGGGGGDNDKPIIDPIPERPKRQRTPVQDIPNDEPEIEPPTIKYTPFYFSFEMQTPKTPEMILYQLNFICLEFAYAVQYKWFVEEKFQNLLFNTGFFSFSCQDSDIEFDPQSPWIQQPLNDREFETRGFVFFNQEVRIGEYIFFRKKKQGEYETYNICYELDIVFQNTFITKQNCAEEVVHDSRNITFQDPIPTIFQQYYSPMVVDMADAINQLNIELEGFLFQDTLENVLLTKILSQNNEYKFSAYTFQCTDQEGTLLQQPLEYQMRARQGFLLVGYVDKFPDVPIKIELVNHQQMYYEIYISMGLEQTKFFLQTSYPFTKQKFKEFMKDIQEQVEAKNKELESAGGDDQEKQSKLSEFERQYKQDKLVELFEISHFKEIKEYILSQYQNIKNGQQQNNYTYLKATIENTQSLDQSFFKAESEKLNSSKLSQYFKTNMLSLSVFATTFNFVFMLFDYKRLGLSKQNISNMISVREILLQQPEKIDQQQQEDTNKQCANYFQTIELENDIYSITLSELNQWIFQEQSDQKFGDLSELMEEFQLVPEVTNPDIILSIDQINDLITYDLTMITQGYRQESLNKVEFLYGNSKFGQKMKVTIYQFQYKLFNIYVITFKNFFFSNSFIFNFESQQEFLIHLGQVIVDVNNHFKLLVSTVQKTLFNCDDLTVQMVEQVIDQVLQTFPQIPGSFCKSQNQNNSNTVLSYSYNFKDESQSKWSPGNKCSGNSNQFQEVFLVREFNDKFQFVFNGIRSVNKKKQLSSDEKTGKVFNQTYTFLKKNGYDYKPVLFRQVHSVLNHLFNGAFSNKVPEDNSNNQFQKYINLIQ